MCVTVASFVIIGPQSCTVGRSSPRNDRRSVDLAVRARSGDRLDSPVHYTLSTHTFNCCDCRLWRCTTVGPRLRANKQRIAVSSSAVDSEDPAVAVSLCDIILCRI